MMVKQRIKCLAAALIAGTLVFSSTPIAAFAVTQADVDAAQAQLSELAFMYANADEEYHDTLLQIEETKKQIAETEDKISDKQAELEDAREVLADRVRANYKSGGTMSLVSLFTNSESIEDFVSNVYYADKAVQQDVDTINAVKDLQKELDEQHQSLLDLQSEQESLAEAKRVSAENLALREAQQQAYVNSLSAELQRQIEEDNRRRQQEEAERARRAAEAAQAAAEQEAQQQAQQQQQSQQQEQQSQQQEQQSQQTEQQTEQTTPEQTPAEESSSASTPSTPSVPSTPAPTYTPTYSVPPIVITEVDNSESTLTAAQRSAIVTAAYSQVGLPYGHANIPNVQLDCSGLVAYCYGCAGINISAGSITQIPMIKNTSHPQPGDVVGWWGNVPGGSYPRHVAIYIGDGMILHANGRWVAVEPLAQWSPYTCIGPLV